jgi:hypothetical protein
MAFWNYEDMTGVDRLNIHECQSVFCFTDDADRPFPSDEFTENAGFQIQSPRFRSIRNLHPYMSRTMDLDRISIGGSFLA